MSNFYSFLKIILGINYLSADPDFGFTIINKTAQINIISAAN